MSWTYVVAQLSTTPLFQIRFLCGDTDTADQLLQDEEINYLLSVFSTYEAAAQACEAIATKFSRFADQSTGDISTSYSQRAAMYSERGVSLRSNRNTHTAIPYAGGISVSDKSIDEEDTDLVKPSFTRDLHLSQY